MRCEPRRAPYVGRLSKKAPVGGRPASLAVAKLRCQPARRPRAARVVVLHLVVVPDHDQRVARVHPTQVRVAADERVLRAVLVERLGDPDRIGPDPATLVAGRVVGLGVDVIAEADHEVHVLLGHERVRVVEAEGVLLAREEREPHGLPGIAWQRGAEAAHLAIRAARGEAVPVLLVRAQAADASLHTVRRAARRGDELSRHHPAKAAVAGHLELDRAATLDVGKPRPQRDSVGPWISGHDSLGEPAAAQARATGAGCEGLRAERRRHRRGTGTGQESPPRDRVSFHCHPKCRRHDGQGTPVCPPALAMLRAAPRLRAPRVWSRTP